MKKHYITAVLDELKNGMEIDAILAGLRVSVKAHKHERIFKDILMGVLSTLESGLQNGVVLTVSREGDSGKYASHIKKALEALEEEKIAREEVDKTLIGGFTISTDTKRIDKSYKKKLVDLYRKVA